MYQFMLADYIYLFIIIIIFCIFTTSNLTNTNYFVSIECKSKRDETKIGHVHPNTATSNRVLGL